MSAGSFAVVVMISNAESLLRTSFQAIFAIHRVDTQRFLCVKKTRDSSIVAYRIASQTHAWARAIFTLKILPRGYLCPTAQFLFVLE